MKINLFRDHSAKVLTLGLLAVCAVLPVQGRVQEGVDTIVNFKGPDGAQPQSIIQDSAGNFYGTTLNGGKYNKGTIFEIEQSGKLVTLVHFNGTNGAAPKAGLLLSPDGSLYGTTSKGGSSGKGTLFRVSPDAKLTTMITFSGSNGADPNSGLLLGPDHKIYGSTESGGTSGKGTVFNMTLEGKATTLVNFNGANGANPGSLVFGDTGNYYGTCYKGGSANKGTAFELTPAGKLRTVVTFNGANGAYPVSGLAGEGDFYGATYGGGPKDLGVVFTFAPDGKFTILAVFDGTNGSHPDSGLIQWNNGYFYMIRVWQNVLVKAAYPQWSGNNFVGTTAGGGVHGHGTVFRVGDEGNLVTLVSFTGTEGLDLGTTPNSLVPGLDGNIYGTTGYGGVNTEGTVWRLQLQLWPLPIAGATTGSDAGSFRPPPISR